jgi:hypothetical protein
MNTIFNKFQRAVLSLLIAVITASIVTMAALAAGPYTRTEAYIYAWLGGGPQTPVSGCSGTCKYLTQPNQYTNPPEVSTIYAWNMGGVSNIYDWCAYIPSAGQAAVNYEVFEHNNTHAWPVLLNQGNAANHGKFVYLGYSDYLPAGGDTTKYVNLTNQCQSGYYCGGLPVYFDDIKYTTYPTRLNKLTCK